MLFFSQARPLEISQLVTNTRSTGPPGENRGAFVSRQHRATSETNCFPKSAERGPAFLPPVQISSPPLQPESDRPAGSPPGGFSMPAGSRWWALLEAAPACLAFTGAAN